ncbi:flagellar assembly protein FliH [Shewanella sp. Isolate8]|uniref:flagellar assembly protein FliH n=1 Tax=Shewanella sp. Isolate8 TaxID=2908529 RepID=UPI001EFED45A|nr:flagellar assembly protein FliH [Shewanella sp. Isolate8]MCG9745862.1 flagellar assembly protein FliH [Shewanella sp. Isolate8]
MTMSGDKKPQEGQDTQGTQADFSHWQLPDVTPTVDEPKENMFGRIAPQKAAKAVDEPVMPPTLEEIESIRAEAEAEGFAQGQAAGIAKGLEEGRLQGLEQGHEEGYRQGEAQGMEAGLTEAKQTIAQFEALMQQLSMPLSLLDTEIEQALVQLSMTLAKAVIGHELKTHPEHILAALRQGVDALPLKEEGAHLRLHPDDLAIVERLYESAQLTRNRWELEADPTLSRGECIVSNSRSRVDMGLEHRIKAVFDKLVASEERLEQQRLQQLAAMEKVSEPQPQDGEAAQGGHKVTDSQETDSQATDSQETDTQETKSQAAVDTSTQLELGEQPIPSDAPQETSPDEDTSKPTT